jgi:primosomal protein N''
MATTANLKEFYTPYNCAQKVDALNGVIHGVAVITSGVKARGHDLEVDAKTLDQIKECAEKLGTVPVKWNHRTGADAVNGYLDNFRIEDAKLLGDWHLLKSHDRFAQAIEMAERMPGNVGLSAAFMGEDEMENGQKKARCSELISVDLVANPAANPSGLFEAKLPAAPTEFAGSVDTRAMGEPFMDNNQNNQASAAAEPSMGDLLAAIQNLTERVAAQDETIAALSQEGAENDNEISLEEIMDLSQEDIAALVQAGEISEEDAAGIQAYQAEVIAAIEADEAGEQGEGNEPAGELAGAGVESSAGSTEGTALSALQNQVRELSARFAREDAAAENNEIEHYFSTIEGNMTQLAAERAELKEFADNLAAENDALRNALKTGIRPLAFSAEGAAISGKNGELHEFEARVQNHKIQGKSHAQAVMLAHKENPDAHQDWIRNQG